MIYEYALEPTVLLAWASNDRDYAEFLREYGLGTSRLISSFPKKKASKLRSYLLQRSPLDEQSIAGLRYTEMVTTLVESIVLRDVSDPLLELWSESVIAENNRVPFDVILSSEPIDSDINITPESMYAVGSVWNHSDQINIHRTNEGFFAAIANVVRLASKDIIIIDPYGYTDKATSFLSYMLNQLHRRRIRNELPKISLFYKERRGSQSGGTGSPAAEHVKGQIVQGLTFDASQIELYVTELKDIEGNDVFHNRCILTELGGVITGHGIGVSGEDAHTDEAILMNSDTYNKNWTQFVEQCCFEVVSKA
ncbi:hypothetical protein HJ014_06130 [Vibrio parahaemolyticus]|nr:hypothetical protein [Vibrio parahaemolyticus]